MKTGNLIFVVVIMVGSFIIGTYSREKLLPPTINVTSCPSIIPTEKVEYVKMDGWDCKEAYGSGGDLLQPSGLWIMKTLDCVKLDIPIEQYVRQECARTGDDYWCNRPSKDEE